MTRARDVSNDQANLGGAVAPFVAGKNKIINGDFGVWQRGTSFSSGFTADRWVTSADVGLTFSQQTFTPGTAPVVGYEGTYFGRFSKTSGGTYGIGSYQKIEDVRVLAGQTVTLSFWAKADSAIAITPYYNQVFGTGGSGTVGNAIGTVTLSTSWARYSLTFAMPSMSGKTIGTNSFTEVYVTRYIGSAAVVIDLWGVQLEAGSVATPFQTASGSIGGELALCQRYYWRFVAGTNYGSYASGCFTGTLGGYMDIPFPVPMRINPTSLDFANLAGQILNAGLAILPLTALYIDQISQKDCSAAFAVASGGTATVPVRLINNNNTAGYLGFSAEL